MKNLTSFFTSTAMWTVVVGVVIAGVLLNLGKKHAPEPIRGYLP